MTIGRIRKFLEGYNRRELQNTVLKKAAVLMLFYPRNDELYVLLTKRTEDVEHHKGQISFPGGSQDEEDATLTLTALRECEEEIGLQRSAIEVLGMFDEFEVPTGFAVNPVVAYARQLPPLHPNVTEVAEILEVPVSLFLDKTRERIEIREWRGARFEVYFYRFGEHEIWGATAAIMRRFLLSLNESRTGTL